MNSRVTSLENTKAFIRENLTNVVNDFAAWRTSGCLPAGKFRQAAQKLESVASMGSYGQNNYVTGQYRIVETIMLDYLVRDHLLRAGYLGENI